MIRGSSAITDSRKKVYTQKFPKLYETNVEFANIIPHIKKISEWVEKKTLEVLGFEDDVLNGLIENYLTNSQNQISIGARTEAERYLDPKEFHVTIQPFLGEEHTTNFMTQLLQLLLDVNEKSTSANDENGTLDTDLKPYNNGNEKERESEHRNKDKRHKSRSRSRSRNRYRGRDGRRRSRSSNRNRERDYRKRSRSRNDRYRSRSKDRHRQRDRHKDRQRERVGDRERSRRHDRDSKRDGDSSRSRDRDRNKERRERNRDRDRS